ncbi:MAG: BON domain-containing protein [Pyrinomonadaceae bacterium]
MKRIINFIALSIAIAAFSFLNTNAQGSSDLRSAQTIEHKVFKEIITLPYYGVFDHIAFKVDRGTVTLYGKVISLGTRKAAENEVRRIPGVTNVVNNIENLPLGSFDNSIRRQMLKTFSDRGGSLYRYLLEPNPSIRIIVDGGHVSLEGFVANRGDSDLANILAKGVRNVFSVTNNLVVGKAPR